MVKLNLIGQRFTRLLAVRETENRSFSGGVIWECLCDCGNKVYTSAVRLRSEQIRSCGCYHKERTTEANRIELAGQHFNRWTVLKEVGRKQGSVAWLCRCECGTERVHRSSTLTNGGSKPCGCFKIDRAIETHTTHGLSKNQNYDNAVEQKRREAKRGVDCEWTPEMGDALHKCFISCVLCGSAHKPSTDHLLPLELGYGLYIDNAVVLCGSCNSRKGSKYISDLPKETREVLIESSLKFQEYWELLCVPTV